MNLPIELRSATLADVRPRERIIELIAVPWDEWTPVIHQGRAIEESFLRGAFGNVQNRADRFLVHLDHENNPDGTAKGVGPRIGRVQELNPEHRSGLWTAMKIRRNPEGDQALDDAEDGLIGASVGFAAAPEHQRWEGRSRRQIVKAFLDHIALTWTPAYQGAGVLAVRSQATAPAAAAIHTPNLDSIRLARLAAEYDRRQV